MNSIKRLLMITVALIMTLALAACGDVTPSSDDTNQTNPPATNNTPPSDGDTPTLPPPDNGDENTPASIDGGTFEGELDENGRFTGWGIWIYHNFRYEGYFVDGVPNGEGTLYETRTPPAERQDGMLYYTLIITEGFFVDGFAHGTVSDTRHLEDGTAHYWSYDVEHGYTQGGTVAVCSDCPADLTLGADTIVGGVPPWADVYLQLP